MPVKSNTFAFVLACSLSGVASFVPSPSLPRLVSPLRTHAPISVGLQTNNILILDHLNINHEKGRHDLLKAFYFDVLKCAVDPRKEENWDKGSGTLWANCGINQFHLPQEQEAQVLAGRIFLEYQDLAPVVSRLKAAPQILAGSKFSWSELPNGGLQVRCPWGNLFEIRQGQRADPRGKQPGPSSEALGMPELQINVPAGSNLAGIARFYDSLVGAKVDVSEGAVQVTCGEMQKLAFVEQQPGVDVDHSDYHVSMYVDDFQNMFQRMAEHELIFVNPRFKRKASTLEEAVDQCMFRVRDIIDPSAPAQGSLFLLLSCTPLPLRVWTVLLTALLLQQQRVVFSLLRACLLVWHAYSMSR